MIQNFVFADGVFIILFCSLRGTPCIGYTRYMPLWLVFLNMFIIKLFSYDLKTYIFILHIVVN